MDTDPLGSVIPCRCVCHGRSHDRVRVFVDVERTYRHSAPEQNAVFEGIQNELPKQSKETRDIPFGALLLSSIDDQDGVVESKRREALPLDFAQDRLGFSVEETQDHLARFYEACDLPIRVGGRAQGVQYGDKPPLLVLRIHGVVRPLVPSAQRPQLSRFGPREERETQSIRRWAEVGCSEKLAAGGTRRSRLVRRT